MISSGLKAENYLFNLAITIETATGLRSKSQCLDFEEFLNAQ